MGCLPARVQRVIELACGWGGHTPLSLAASGRQWGLTRERVCQLHDQGLALLRLPVFSLHLRNLDEQDRRTTYRKARRRRRAGR